MDKSTTYKKKNTKLDMLSKNQVKNFSIQFSLKKILIYDLNYHYIHEITIFRETLK
jgi:hypothetical protein